MVEWSKHLYVGAEAGKKKHRYQKDVERGTFRPGLYVITPAASGRDLLDMIPAYELNQPFYRDRQIRIYGLALGRGEALELVRSLVTDCYLKTGDFQIDAWLQTQK
ncbi:MAG: hypothetical protein LUE29_12220 [Lachnospiraceae bacterium]|nr:hypothetical protein [Lachnospiraceae bacterium]